MLSSPIEEIKNRLDVRDVIGGYVKLQKAGANYRALCPFHSEKTPSFFVSPARQVWRCFGCGVGGDVFKFIMQIDGIEFGDALRVLASRAGVELQKASPLFIKLQTERKRLFEIVEWATKFFETQLSSSSGQEVLSYLLKRGFTKESIAKWRLGYAPDSARSLFDFLQGKGFGASDISRAGLLVSSGGETYDRFRSRVIFPVFDLNSQAVGFGGRIFGEKAADKEIAKYINTSNTPLYDKSRILYGLDKAKMEIRQSNFSLLVEGYVDTILVSQAGFANVVAVSGTALTIFHLKLLRRYSDNVLLSFDMDLGGDTATKRGIDLAIAEGFNVKVVTMEEGKDPADIVSKDPALWINCVKSAKSIFDFYFDQTFQRFSKKSAEGKKEIARILLPLIKKIPNRIEQSHWISLLSNELGAKEEDIHAELKKLPEEQGSYIPFSGDTSSKKIEIKTRRQRLEERIFILLCREPSLLAKIEESKTYCFSLQSQEILEGMRTLRLRSGQDQFDFKMLETVFSPDLVEYLNHISLRAGIEDWENEKETSDIALEFKNCIVELEHLYMRNRLDEISQEISSAEQLKDTERTKTLMEQFSAMSKDLHLRS